MKVEIHVNGAKRQKNGLAQISIQFPSSGGKRLLEISLEEFIGFFGALPSSVCDLLLVASIVYVIDKCVRRSESEDQWTRDFEVRIPVNDPKSWNRVASALNNALSFLSGDIWSISFRAPGCPLFLAPKKRQRLSVRASFDTPNCVISLFSGGLDSLAGGINLLEGRGATKVVLIGHGDRSGSGAHQRRLYGGIKDKFRDRAHLLQMKIGHRPSRALEPTSRCRSFLFLALGISAAACVGSKTPLFAHENGVIAINLPLNPARAGSCSTRTMHPYFLGSVEKILRGLSIANPVSNPFSLQTKGQCLAGCLNQALLKELYPSAVSCAHGNRRRYWKRRKSRNCGYCMPCIFRRAALHKLKKDDGQEYGLDFCAGEIQPTDDGESSDDLRAITDFLRRPRSKESLAKQAYQASPISSPDQVGSMLDRGYSEVADLIRAKGNKELLRAAAMK